MGLSSRQSKQIVPRTPVGRFASLSHLNQAVIQCGIVLILGLLSPKSNASDIAPEMGLGRVRFANSCSSQVQPGFNAALAMLHSFQYGLAEKAFILITEQDPQCAMAYWGSAMSLYHQLWDWPDALTVEKGRAYLEKAKPLPKSERESAYLNAAMAFFQPEQTLGKRSRIQVYCTEMEKLHNHYPRDPDATALYALSLLTLPSRGNDGATLQRKAVAILLKLFAEWPDHPGVAHYLIHAADSPEFARSALPAALRYAQIAPSSPHALHMPSHIFSRLGMWQDSIASNLASIEAAEEATNSQRDDESGDALHAMMYLAYSYAQAGQNEDARRVTEHLRAVPDARAADVNNNLSILEALDAVEIHDWNRAAHLTVRPQAFPFARIRTFWARAIGAARTSDTASAQQDLKKLEQASAGMLAYMRSVDCEMHTGHTGNPQVTVQQLEVKAWLLWAQGQPTQAIVTMEAAVRMEDSFSVESRTVPAYEMLGDLLLELRQPKRALRAYMAALKEAPGRLNAVAGAARASQAVGDSQQAKFYYAMLIQCCSPRSTRAEVAEARRVLAGN